MIAPTSTVKSKSTSGARKVLPGGGDSEVSRITVGYIRCSTQEQVRDGETMERQESMIKSYCVQKNITDLRLIVDEGLSGFKSNRPGFQEVIRLCREGVVERVIVYDLSRLSRSVRDTLEFIEDTVHRYNISFVSLVQDLDTSTPMGKAFLGFTAIFNQLYRDEISFKTRLAIQHKKSKSERYSSSIPYGYDHDGNGNLIISIDDQHLIALIADLKKKGKSLRSICRHLADNGYKTKTGNAHWHPQTIRDLLEKAVSHGGRNSGCQETDHV